MIEQALQPLSKWLEPGPANYGYEIKPAHIDAAVAELHRSRGDLAHTLGFTPFSDAVARHTFPKAMAVKGQIAGPITLSTQLFYRNRPFLSDPSLFAAVVYHVSQMLAWQADQLTQHKLPVLVFVDEPALPLSSPEVLEDRGLTALSALFNSVRRRGAIGGLHCCATEPFEMMCQAAPDILSFDAHVSLESFFATRLVRRFVSQGNLVAYGLVPTWPNLERFDAHAAFTRWLKAARSAGDPRELAQRAIITATCGLGLLSHQSARESFAKAHEIGSLMRSLLEG